MYAHISRGTAPTFTGPQYLYCYLWGHPKPLLYSATIENEQRHRRIFISVKPFAIAPGHLKMYDSHDQTSPCVKWFRWRVFEHMLLIVT